MQFISYSRSKSISGEFTLLLIVFFHPEQDSSRKTVILIDLPTAFEMWKKNPIWLKLNKLKIDL